jgi:CheY-like chemotaxis protein
MVGLLDLLEHAHPQEQAGYIDTLRSVVNQLRHAVDELLDLARLEARKVTLDVQPFDVARTLSDTVSVWRPIADAKGIELKCTISPEANLRLLGDVARIRQIVGNLLNNAIKFTERGEVLLSASRSGDAFSCEICDTGPGVDPAEAARLFEPFEQLDTSWARRHGGTGIGLTICKQLVELHGGTMGVENRASGGARFWFKLPLEQAAELPLPPPTVMPRAVGPQRLLIVDDNAVNRLVLSRVLAKQGHQVETASSGQEAIEIVRQGAFDVVFMDLQMPGMTGMDAVKEIRAFDQLTPIVAMSANMNSDFVRTFRDQGFIEMATKPLTLEELERLLRVALSET